MVPESPPASKAGLEVRATTQINTAVPACRPACCRDLPTVASMRIKCSSSRGSATADNPVLELPTMRDVLQPQDSPFKPSNNSGGGFGALLLRNLLSSPDRHCGVSHVPTANAEY